MAEYWGLVEIARRMGWRSKDTPVKQKLSNGFLMYRRRRGSDPRWRWYSNDELIRTWEISMCQAQREQMLEERKGRNECSSGVERTGYMNKTPHAARPRTTS